MLRGSADCWAKAASDRKAEMLIRQVSLRNWCRDTCCSYGLKVRFAEDRWFPSLHLHQFDSPILRASVFTAIVRDGLRLSPTFRFQAHSIDSVRRQPGHDRLRTLFRKRLICRRGAHVVGVSFDA